MKSKIRIPKWFGDILMVKDILPKHPPTDIKTSKINIV